MNILKRFFYKFYLTRLTKKCKPHIDINEYIESIEVAPSGEFKSLRLIRDKRTLTIDQIKQDELDRKKILK